MKKKNMLLASLCSILILTSGCAKTTKLENGQEVVASIDGKNVTAEELYEGMKEQYGAGILVNIVDEFITDKEVEEDDTVKDYAESQLKQLKSSYEQAGQDFSSALISSGYANEDALLEAIKLDYRKNKVAENYVKDNLTDDEINDYYENEVYGELTVKHILIAPETTSDMTDDEKTEAENAALEKAKEVIEKLNNGEDWATLVKEYSDDEASVDSEGLISEFTKDEVVEEFFNASLNLKDGEYTTEPVKSTYGYHIILRVSQKEKPALEDVIDDIKEELVDDKFDDDSNLYQKAWAEVRKKYNLDIIDTDVKSVYDSTISSLD